MFLATFRSLLLCVLSDQFLRLGVFSNLSFATFILSVLGAVLAVHSLVTIVNLDWLCKFTVRRELDLLRIVYTIYMTVHETSLRILCICVYI